MTAALVLDGVTKQYVDGEVRRTALANADLTVQPGEFVAVMGPSGSGKSTLLTIAGGLETPSKGEVVVNGVHIGGLGRDARAEFRLSNIGYVFQEYNLVNGLTALENVALPLELAGDRRSNARTAALTALAAVGLDDRAYAFPDSLSGGERQRVAIARALVTPPAQNNGPDRHRRLVLADEPTGALDSLTGEAVMRLLSGCCAEGAAVVLVTHDAALASWADRTVYLRDGRIVDETAPVLPVEDLLVSRP